MIVGYLLQRLGQPVQLGERFAWVPRPKEPIRKSKARQCIVRSSLGRRSELDERLIGPIESEKRMSEPVPGGWKVR